MSPSVATTPRTMSQGLRDPLPERALDQGRPQGVVADPFPQLGAGGQGSGERREHRPCQVLRAGVQRGPARVVPNRADPGERATRGVRIVGDEQPASQVGGGRERVVPATHDDPDVQIEVVDDQPGQQADQVGVARQPRGHARERLPGGAHRRRHGRTADLLGPLQHQHPTASASQVGGGRERVVPATDDDHIPPVRPVRTRLGRSRLGGYRLCRTTHPHPPYSADRAASCGKGRQGSPLPCGRT